ncbi:hypothetical protein GCM10010392_20370 [Streptomyces clavifer]|nr:hypothetical protein GCM10010392_20370 [Streptomyces clavifer]
MRYERTVSGRTRMCAAMSWYDQSLLSVMNDTSLYLRTLRAAFSAHLCPLNDGVAGRAGAVAIL